MSGARVARVVASLIAIAGVAFALTLLFDGMRAVMAVGGTCASGNTAYVIQTQCPDAVAWVMPLAIFGGLLFAGIYAASAPESARSVVLLAWPALFISLGWNFLQAGFGWVGGAGVQPVGLILGAMFVIMGGAPLLFWVPQLVRAAVGGKPEHHPAMATSPHIQLASTTWYVPTPAGPAATSQSPGAPGGNDLSGELERLAGLHRRGELSDAEYDAAKQRVIGAAT